MVTSHSPILIPRAHAELRAPLRPYTSISRSPGIVLHCTGGRRPVDERDALAAWRATQAWHQQGNGWSDVGYSFSITPTGAILEGRGWGIRGAHTKGHNECLGIVVQGKGDVLTDEERNALDWLVAEHERRYGRGFVVGHRSFSPRKSCPGPAVLEHIAERYGDRRP